MRKENDILVLDKIQDLYRNLEASPIGLDERSEFFIHDLGLIDVAVPFTSPIYRANFYSFVFVKNAKGTSFSDHYIFDFQPQTVYFNNPGYIKHVVFRDLKELYLVLMNETFLKKYTHPDIYEEFPFLLSEIVPPRILNDEVYLEFEILYKQILKEFSSSSVHKLKLIGHLVAIILLKLKQYFWNDYDPVEEGNRNSQIVKRFKQAIEKHYRNLSKGVDSKVYRLHEYAAAQNLHPNYFNTVIKSKTGKSVGTWITEKTITEAKTLLSISDISIKEIAWRLGFAESAHFSNYFKKHTTISPIVYRRQHFKSTS
ncbi:MAG TPA: helix-turn-helix domain-containing protein [Puia sp.]|nr:helix-turn-helix domain-containing protein [Puia sp.]